MAVNKNQHYVAQFYFRNFSSEQSGKRIALCHLPTGRYVPAAAIGDQASDDYFYADEDVDGALTALEGIVAPVIGNCLTRSELPPVDSADFGQLRLFTILQAARTQAAADELDALLGELSGAIVANGSQAPVSHTPATVPRPAMASVSVRVAADLAWSVRDLAAKLLVNDTNQEFVTSDHPAVRYNLMFDVRSALGSNVGYLSRGLLLFVPLGPKHLLLLFDAAAYKVGGKQSSVRVVKLAGKKGEKDVDGFNLLQAVNAGEHIYSSGRVGCDYLARLARKAAHVRGDRAASVQANPGVEKGTGRRGILYQLSKRVPQVAVELDCVRLLRSCPPLVPGPVQVRDEFLHRRFGKYMMELQHGRAAPGSFATWSPTSRS